MKESLTEDGDDDARAARFGQWVLSDLRGTMSDDQVEAYEEGAPPDLSWYGLARYWRKKDPSGE